MNRLFERLLAALNMIASVWILFLVALISADVVGRSALNQPVPGVPEIVKFSIVAMVWLQMGYVLRSGAHLRTMLGLKALPVLGRRVVLFLNSVIGMAVLLLVAWLGWSETLHTWEVGAFEGEHPVRIPMWPIWAIMVGGAALTSVQYLLDALRVVYARPEMVEAQEAAGAELIQ